ncbi:MAG: hypothetical protein JWM80_722 [Cyanobacteria bacterium RYN_339]|nr:hypothetical protein [Cyanobacteria bacterium RYN_339]
MPVLVLILLLYYAASLAVQRLVPTAAPMLEVGALALELGLDVLVIVLAGRVAGGLPFRLIQLSFAATILSTCNYQVLSRVFGVVLKKTMGTWLELEINVPYLGFFALGAAALWLLAGRARALSLVATAVILAILVPPLLASGFPLQNQVLHVLCFVLSGLIWGAGLQLWFAGKHRLPALGYMAMSLSGLLFQFTELRPGVYPLDLAIDLTWTLGQFAMVGGLLIARAPTRRSWPR